ncbi:MAG: hypothetical protein Q4B88_02715 [Moraxella sp.]|nr:hypothetical protein [Moraxella sp.]
MNDCQLSLARRLLFCFRGLAGVMSVHEEKKTLEKDKGMGIVVLVAVLLLHAGVVEALGRMQMTVPKPKVEPIRIEMINLLESQEPPKPMPEPTPEVMPVTPAAEPAPPKVKPTPAPKPASQPVTPPTEPAPREPAKSVAPPPAVTQSVTVDDSAAKAALAKEAAEKAAAEQAQKEATEREAAAKAAREAAQREAEATAKAQREAAEKAQREAEAAAKAQREAAEREAAAKAQREAEAAAKAKTPVQLSSSEVEASWRSRPNLHFSVAEKSNFNPSNTHLTASFNFDEKGNISNVRVSGTGDAGLDRVLRQRIARAKLHPKVIDGTPRHGSANISINFNW